MATSIPIHNTPGDVKVIHVTDRRTFKECRAKYKYAVIDRINSSEEAINALWIGTGGHHVMADVYEAQKQGIRDRCDPLSSWDEYKIERQAQPDEEMDDMMKSVLLGYCDFYEDADADWTIIEVEKTYQVVIQQDDGTEMILQATIDLLIKDRMGYLWIVDHKFLRDFNDPKTLELDDQMTAYIWILAQHGINVRGCIYNVIRKKVPTVPRLLKCGSKLSVAKNIDTTHAVYLKCITDCGFDPDDEYYTEILDDLAKRPSEFFRRTPVMRNPKELFNFGQDLYYEIADMSSPTTRYYPSPGMQCKWCQFQTLCKADREGSDTELLKRAFYRIREDHER